MLPKFIEHGFMNSIFYVLGFVCISGCCKVCYCRNEPVDFGKRQQSRIIQFDFGSDLWIRWTVVIARKNLQVSNAILVIENFVATPVLRFLSTCKFGVRLFLQPPRLVGLEPVV